MPQTVSDSPVRLARRKYNKTARDEATRSGLFARRLLMLAAKVLDRSGDRDGQILALTAVSVIDDLVEHLKGGKK